MHAARAQHETIPEHHGVRAMAGGILKREPKRREQSEHAAHRTDELPDGVARSRALLARGALRVEPICLDGAELAQGAHVPLEAVTAATDAGFFATAARGEPGLVILGTLVQVL